MFLFWLKLKLSKLHSFCHITWEHKSGIILLSFIVLLTSLIMLLFQQCPYISLNQWWHRAIFHIWLQPLAVSNKVLSYQKSLNYFSFAIYTNNDKITVRIFLEFTLGNFWGLLTVCCVFSQYLFQMPLCLLHPQQNCKQFYHDHILSSNTLHDWTDWIYQLHYLCFYSSWTNLQFSVPCSRLNRIKK